MLEPKFFQASELEGPKEPVAEIPKTRLNLPAIWSARINAGANLQLTLYH